MFDLISKGWDGLVQSFYGLYQIGRGLKTVGMHTFRQPTTGTYPDVMPHVPVHFRGRLALTVNPETGENLCISCRQCERVCPDKCIDITAHKSPETNKLELIDFKIDHGLCMFCGLCTEVCPTSCIINTTDFEMADYTRQSLIYDLKKLTLSQEESAFYFEAKEMPLPKPKPVKAAAPAKPAGEGAAATPAAAKPATAAATAEKPAAPAADKPAAPADKPATPAAEKSAEPAAEKPAAPAADKAAAPAPEKAAAEAPKPAAEQSEKKSSEETKGETDTPKS